jgi:hypothetical protein
MLLNTYGGTSYINVALQMFLNNETLMSYLRSKEFSDDSYLYLLLNLDGSCYFKKLLSLINVSSPFPSTVYDYLVHQFCIEDETLESILLGKKTIIHQCFTCKCRSDSVERFSSISLLSKNDSISMGDAINDLFTFSVGDRLCNECNPCESLHVRTKITEWPQQLVFCVSDRINFTKQLEITTRCVTYNYTMAGTVYNKMNDYTYVKISREADYEFKSNGIFKIKDLNLINKVLLLYNRKN